MSKIRNPKEVHIAIAADEANGKESHFNLVESTNPKLDNPFAVFTEWSGKADEKAYAKLKP
jgi:hypothetical protein